MHVNSGCSGQYNRSIPIPHKLGYCLIKSQTSKRAFFQFRAVGDSSQKPDLVDDSALSTLSPMAREVLKEAEENILALNNSRMKALQELKQAKEKIAELEKKLEEATIQVTSLTTVVTQPGAIVPHSSNNNHNHASPSPAASTQNYPPVSTAFGQSVPDTKVILVYESGWEYAFIHCKIDDSSESRFSSIFFHCWSKFKLLTKFSTAEWTALPGTAVPVYTDGEYAGKKVVALVSFA